MAIPAFLVAAGKGIVAGATAIKGFLVGKGAILASAATIGATALSGTVFEGKKKKITLGRSESMTAGKYSFRVPQVRVENLRSPKDVSPRSNRARDANYSRKRSNRYS